MNDLIEVPQWALLNAIRYALGRHTYVVGETAALVRSSWPNLTTGSRSLIRRDVIEYVGRQERDKQPDDGIDLKEWEDLVVWMVEQS